MIDFSVNRRNPGHWDVFSDQGRLFCIRGSHGDHLVRDERKGRSREDNRNFRTLQACMNYICDVLMYETPEC